LLKNSPDGQVVQLVLFTEHLAQVELQPKNKKRTFTLTIRRQSSKKTVFTALTALFITFALINHIKS
jgi:1,4-dihydroxy-2-naphthoate octaprenyltransferase